MKGLKNKIKKKQALMIVAFLFIIFCVFASASGLTHNITTFVKSKVASAFNNQDKFEINRDNTPKINVSFNDKKTAATIEVVNYPETAVLKQYKLDSSRDWQDYTGKFTIDENTIIQTRYKNAEEDNYTIGSSKIVLDIVKLSPFASKNAGETITIGNERFRVREKYSNYLIAVPYYNITVWGGTPAQAYSAGTIAFSTSNYWGFDEGHINCNDSRNLLWPIVQAYQKKLNSLVDANIVCNVPTYWQAMNTENYVNWEVYGVWNNPGKAGKYWIRGVWYSGYWSPDSDSPAYVKESGEANCSQLRMKYYNSSQIRIETMVVDILLKTV